MDFNRYIICMNLIVNLFIVFYFIWMKYCMYIKIFIIVNFVVECFFLEDGMIEED